MAPKVIGKRLDTPSRYDLRPAATAKVMNYQVVHPLAHSLSSELEVSALVRCHAAISPLFCLTSAHIRSPGCRYVNVLRIVAKSIS